VGRRSGAVARGARSAGRGAWRSLVALASLATWSASSAAEEHSPFSPLALETHGFVSQGFIFSTKNEYLAKSKRGSFEFTEVGINFSRSLSESLRVGLQLFAHDLGPIGNYSPEFDWYSVDYRAWDWLGIRIGRNKIPFGLFNELNDIDVARVPILLPQSIYQVDHREFLFAQTGVELYGDVRLGGAGAFEYRAYGGTLSGPPPLPPPPGIAVRDVDIPYVYGGRLLWFTPLDGLSGGVSGQALRLDGAYDFDPALRTALEGATLLPPGLTYPTPVKFRVTRWVASLQYAAHDLDLSAEYSRWTGEFYSRAPQLFPPHTVNERYYAMASYRMSSWFTPGVYYSALFDNVENRHQRGGFQHDVAFTTRYDFNAHWLLKLEGHVIHGTAALDNRALNDGVERAQLTPTWGLFLIKTTAYF
jgi:hypothetical protein